MLQRERSESSEVIESCSIRNKEWQLQLSILLDTAAEMVSKSPKKVSRSTGFSHSRVKNIMDKSTKKLAEESLNALCTYHSRSST